MNARTCSRRSAITSGMTAVAIGSDDRRDEGGAPTAFVRDPRPRGRAVGTRSPGRRRLERGVGSRCRRRAAARTAGGRQRDPPAYALARRRGRGATRGARRGRQGAPGGRPYRPPRRARGGRGGTGRGRGDRGARRGGGGALGGVGGVEGYVERYNELTGFDVRPEELDYWELAGNVAWAIGCLTQMQRHLTGQDRSVELAILGRLGVEVEYEIVNLLERFAA